MKRFDKAIEAAELNDLLPDSDLVLIDCRFYLDNVNRGQSDYEREHISTAQYAHLDLDLCAPLSPGSGRHPLPSQEAMAQLFGRLGISTTKQVVVYDGANGIAATRLWWMLQLMGHKHAAVLDGGLPAWKAAGFPVASGIERNSPEEFTARFRPELLVSMHEVPSARLLIDSRSPERYQGEFEPIDPIAGHIPGASNRFHLSNYSEGRLLPAAVLREQFEQLLGDVPAEEAVFYCGSGVTACNNLLALAHAGLGEGKMYAGSWSEWCAYEDNGVSVGNEQG